MALNFWKHPAASEDYSVAANWSLGAVPVATNDVVFDVGSANVRAGLDQSAVALDEFRVVRGCSSQFGKFADGVGQYLQIDPDLFRYEGNGQLAMFDLGAAPIGAYIAAFGSPTGTGRHAVYLKGSALGVIEIAKGNIGLAPLEGDAATITEIICGFLESPQSDVDLTVGRGVTLTTLTQTGGRCRLECAAGAVDVSAGAFLTTEGTGAISTAVVRGTAYLNAGGTITNLHVHGTVDFSRDRTPRTVQNVFLKPGGVLVIHDDITITTLSAPAEPGEAKIIRV